MSNLHTAKANMRVSKGPPPVPWTTSTLYGSLFISISRPTIRRMILILQPAESRTLATLGSWPRIARNNTAPKTKSTLRPLHRWRRAAASVASCAALFLACYSRFAACSSGALQRQPMITRAWQRQPMATRALQVQPIPGLNVSSAGAPRARGVCFLGGLTLATPARCSAKERQLVSSAPRMPVANLSGETRRDWTTFWDGALRRVRREI